MRWTLIVLAVLLPTGAYCGCGTIRDHDMRNYCLGSCGLIHDHDLRQMCFNNKGSQK